MCRDGVPTDEPETQSCERADPGMVVADNRAAVCMTDAGGILELPGGQLVIPANALTDPTELYLEQIDDAPLAIAGLSVLGSIFSAGPADTVLALPATVSSNFEGDRDRAALFVEQTPDFRRLGGRVIADTVLGEVEQLGIFLVADGVEFSLSADRSCAELRTVDGRVQEPSTVALFFTIDDCAGRPLTNLEQPDFEILEGENPLNADVVRRISPKDDVQAFVSLVLDLSASTRNHLGEVISGAQSFVRLLKEERGLDVQIGIELFAGDQFLTRWQSPNLDTEVVLDRLATIGEFTPDAAGVTNLNGAIIQGLQRLAEDAEGFRIRNRGGAFTVEHLVVFTDGTDTAGLELNEAVVERIAASTAEVTIVGLASPDVEALALQTLPVDVIIAPETASLRREFQTIAARIADGMERAYLLTYCTSEQDGEHTVTIRLANTENRGTAQFSFIADSIAGPGCGEALVDDQCADKQCGGLGCGFCDDRTAVCNSNGQCQSYCETAPVTTAIAVTDRCDYPNPLGYIQFCEQDISTLCSETCTDLTNDPENCGGCGLDCGPNVVGVVNGEGSVGESCQDNVCQCAPGWYGETCDQTQCGDGFLTPDEICDDGNDDNTDGCTDTCVGWVQVASLPPSFNETHHSFGFSFGGFGYLVSGNSRSEVRDDFYQYDPNNDVWTELAPFPGSARGFAIGDTWAGKAYFGFGRSSSDFLNDFWVFDPANMEWTELASCPCSGRRHPAMVAQNGKVFIGMGNNSNGNLKDWWAYDIASNTWSQKEDFPAPKRHHPYQFGIDDYVYTGFGHGNGIFDDWYRYDSVEETWTQVASLPAEGRVAGTQFSYNGIGYVLSGDGEDHRSMETGEFWAYDPVLDTWSALPAHPGSSRWAPASFIIGGEVYLINGKSFGLYTSEIYKYDLTASP